MMMLAEMTAILLSLLLFSTAVEANTGETLGLKLYNDDFHPSAIEMQKRLKEANLESHGYNKEVITRVVKGPKTERQKAYFYFKIVNCSMVQEVEKELDTLMPGVFGQELATNLKKEVKTRHLGDTGQCKVGMEVIFKKPGGLYGNDKASPQRQLRRGWGVRIRVGIKIRFKVRIRFRRRKRSGR